jgi:hypothetical protein
MMIWTRWKCFWEMRFQFIYHGMNEKMFISHCTMHTFAHSTFYPVISLRWNRLATEPSKKKLEWMNEMDEKIMENWWKLLCKFNLFEYARRHHHSTAPTTLYLQNNSVIHLERIRILNEQKKIWCASWARVNLPHISNEKCIKIVLQRNLFKNTRGLSLFSRNLYRRYRWDVKYQNF